ncbi:MAG TPA: S9 family peptidase [Pseudonocardia sp.]|uniref:S9 family peptidase n=1 Tax=Pseudonocardia sp. TaxID=60912 RepID=UPI002ED8DA54
MNTVSTFTDRRRAQLLAGPEPALGLVPDWLTAPGYWSPSLSPDGSALAFVSDRDGMPALWVAPVVSAPLGSPSVGSVPVSSVPVSSAPVDEAAVRLETGPDHVRGVLWSPDGRWLACLLAPYGGEHTRVLVVRPDGSELRVLAGGEGHAATFGPWLMDGSALGVTEAGPGGDPVAYVIDPDTGRRTRLAEGQAAHVCAFSPNGRHAVVRVGRRGARELRVVHIESGRTSRLLVAGSGPGWVDDSVDNSATVANARYAIDGARLYVHTDYGRERSALLALPLTRSGLRKDGYARHSVVAARPDADLDTFALCGGTIAAVWNVAGRSEVELIEPDYDRRRLLDIPADVVTGVAFAHDGSELLVTAEGPAQPSCVWRYPLRCPDTHTPAEAEPSRLVPAAPPPWDADELVSPTLCHYAAADGLELSGWLYYPLGGPGPAPTVLWLHGGPEAQERPTFAPLLQELVATGVAVFAPNVRGSSGYGRDFVNADNHERRFAAISDVAEAARFLVAAGLADPTRIGVAGRSYGGYLTLAALVHYPELFRVGVDVCGMADLETFFAHTEPWIAAAATSKYGDPDRDRALLRELSPLHQIERLVAPLLVVHGEHDTNVPLVEAEQVVHALRERGAAPGFLLFPDEGHEVHGTANRVTFVREVVRWLTGHLLEVDEQTA